MISLGKNQIYKMYLPNRLLIKDGKDQMAPLIESDENRELFQKLAQAISNIPGTGTMAIAEK